VARGAGADPLVRAHEGHEVRAGAQLSMPVSIQMVLQLAVTDISQLTDLPL